MALSFPLEPTFCEPFAHRDVVYPEAGVCHKDAEQEAHYVYEYGLVKRGIWVGCFPAAEQGIYNRVLHNIQRVGYFSEEAAQAC